MKTVSAPLQAFLIAARSGDQAFPRPDCYTINLVNGGVAYFTSYDQAIAWNGHTFLANSLLVSGMKSKTAIGLEVDRQQITLAVAGPGVTINGAPWLEAVRSGALDGATIQRDRVFLSSSLPGGIDGVTLFKGRVSTVDQVGRTSAQITIASPLVTLDNDMPRNLFQPTCLHTLYDAGCGLNPGSFLFDGTAGAGSDQTTILGAADPKQTQGSLIFVSGINSDIRATVKSVVAGVSWTLMYPLPNIPAAGDSFQVFFGCDHTLATCAAKFANSARFRGFPYVPPPEFAI